MGHGPSTSWYTHRGSLQDRLQDFSFRPWSALKGSTGGPISSPIANSVDTPLTHKSPICLHMLVPHYTLGRIHLDMEYIQNCWEGPIGHPQSTVQPETQAGTARYLELAAQTLRILPGSLYKEPVEIPFSGFGEFTYLSFCTSFYLSLYLSACLPIYLSIYLSVYLSIHPSI